MIKKLLEEKKDTLLVIMLILPIILVGIILNISNEKEREYNV